MTEVWFYQLQTKPLDQVLPSLLERTLARGWRAVVQAISRERLAALDEALWTYADESFLPHGSHADDDAALQPVWLTLDQENPNGAQARFLLEGTSAVDFLAQTYERLIVLFDGQDDEALAAARNQWRELRERGAAISYWRQRDNGGWEQQA